MADAVHRYGFELAKLSDDFFNHVRQHIRAGVIRMSNPLDMGDIFDIDAYAGIVEKALSEEGVDGVVFSHAYVAEAKLQVAGACAIDSPTGPSELLVIADGSGDEAPPTRTVEEGRACVAGGGVMVAHAAGTMAALATIVPVGAFKVDTSGCVCPAGHVLRNPSGPDGTTVMFSE